LVDAMIPVVGEVLDFVRSLVLLAGPALRLEEAVQADRELGADADPRSCAARERYHTRAESAFIHEVAAQAPTLVPILQSLQFGLTFEGSSESWLFGESRAA
jgi:hypothetical protein